MSELRQKEIQLFFRIIRQLRVSQQERPWSAPDDAERAELLDEIQTIAKFTDSWRLRRRCLLTLEEFGAITRRSIVPVLIACLAALISVPLHLADWDRDGSISYRELQISRSVDRTKVDGHCGFWS